MGDQLRDALKAAGMAGKGPTSDPGRPPPSIPVLKTVHPLSSPESVRAPGVARSPAPEVTRKISSLVKIAEFHLNPLLEEDRLEEVALPPLSDRGVVRQLTESPLNETDLVIGLDFGTSATKVVIRDRYAANGAYPVCFNDSISGIGAYLLRSRVFRTGRTYSLSGGTHRISDLKLRLLACKASDPVDEFNDCCAFLALVIRRSKGWLFTVHRNMYARHRLNWRLNLGLAARSYEASGNAVLFRRLAWAAANAAADQRAVEITAELVNTYRLLSLSAYSKGVDGVPSTCTWDPGDVDAVPEVSAQLQGFMASARWDWTSRPVMMMVDVGAGTVDSALFHVKAPGGKNGVLTFYSSRVELNGVMSLHRARVNWLRELLPPGPEHQDARTHLDATAAPTDRLRPIPLSVCDYLSGYTINLAGPGVDEDFKDSRYRAQVAGCINDAKVRKGLGGKQLLQVPLLLCGGGIPNEVLCRCGGRHQPHSWMGRRKR